MKKVKAILTALLLVAGLFVIASALAGSASAARVGCDNNTIKLNSSGTNVCFDYTGGSSEYVQLPDTTTIYTGQYSNIHVNVWLCRNYQQSQCNGATYVYNDSLPGAHKTWTYYGVPVDIVNICYGNC